MNDLGGTLLGVAAIISAVGGVAIGLLSLRQQRVTGTKIATVGEAVENVHHEMNSMKDQLVAATALASEAKGRDDERANPTGPPIKEHS